MVYRGAAEAGRTAHSRAAREIMTVDLVLIGGDSSTARWPLGKVHPAPAEVPAIHQLMEELQSGSAAQACLFWDNAFGDPDPETIRRVMSLPGDVWHSGLKLGASGKPGMIDFVATTWMLNCDPGPELEATSWRLSLRAAVIPLRVLRQLGVIRPDFETLEAAALELGHRYIARGAIVRHVPWLAPVEAGGAAPGLPVRDEVLFLYFRFGAFWTRWALARAWLSGEMSLAAALRQAGRLRNRRRPGEPAPLARQNPDLAGPIDAKVSVLVPTVDRYPYLRKLLEQLRTQTVKPYEILVIDQTPLDRRETGLEREFADLPLRVQYLDQSGQCTSRNRGLQMSRGDYVLFVDDDDEVQPDLIELHLRTLELHRADVSCGVAEEVGAGPLPPEFTYFRASNVFPTNNSLIRRSALHRSGLFDLAYDRGQRADGDLGMRLYLSGAVMVLNPAISVLHHHAPRGGLRVHKARVITYASSRQNLLHRHLPSVTEIYLARRYFTPRQQNEAIWQRAFGTLSGRGGWPRRMLKVLVGLFRLPGTWRAIRQRQQQAEELSRRYPDIPFLEESAS